MASSADQFQPKNGRGHLYTPLLPFTHHSSKSNAISQSNSISKTILSILTKLITILILIYTLNMIMAVSLGPDTPTIQLNSLSLSNFTISTTKLAANWVADFTVHNPNLNLEFSLDRIESLIFYREDDALSMASTDGFRLGLRERKNVTVKFATTGWEGNQPIVEYPVLREIEEDRKRGTVRFSMRMTVWATYKAGFNGLEKRVVMNPYCLDLNVGVKAETGNGRLIGNGPKDCSVLMFVTQ